MTDTRFTASNGWYVEGGMLHRSDDRSFGPIRGEAVSASIEYGAHQARAERDAVLGRWRSVENPDWIVYPNTAPLESDGNYRECHVIDERTGNRYHYGSALTERYMGEGKEVAREFFESHPEPKPWEQAEPGEVWSLRVGCNQVLVGAVCVEKGKAWRNAKTGFGIDLDITHGDLVWKPEVTA